MKLLTDIYCLVNDIGIVSNFSYSDELKDVCFSVIVDSSNSQNLSCVYQKISNNKSGQHFCLALDLDSRTVNETLLHDLCSFFFLQNYQHISGSPVILLLGEEQDKNSLLSEKLNEVMKKQYLKQALFINVHGELNPYSFFKDGGKEQFRQRLENKLFDSIRFTQRGSIYVHINDSSAIADVISACYEAEINLNARQPELYCLLGENKALAENVSKLQESVSYLQERLTHQNDYLAFIKSNHEANEIQTFYNKQYEVLPLWYKRFGHVLKFLMRK